MASHSLNANSVNSGSQGKSERPFLSAMPWSSAPTSPARDSCQAVVCPDSRERLGVEGEHLLSGVRGEKGWTLTQPSHLKWMILTSGGA
jgi:hypothetical protein